MRQVALDAALGDERAAGATTDPAEVAGRLEGLDREPQRRAADPVAHGHIPLRTEPLARPECTGRDLVEDPRPDVFRRRSQGAVHGSAPLLAIGRSAAAGGSGCMMAGRV